MIKYLYNCIFTIAFSIVFFASLSNVFCEDDLNEISLEDLSKIKVTTASNSEESLSEAPASMVVITKDEISKRGYNSLIEVFQDLPGIDLSIAYADTYYKAYWRGFRTGMADSWLFMIDGRVMNHLWYNFNDVVNTVALSNIEKVEVVYGPASSVYGANAMTGVVNVITKKNLALNGSASTVKLNYGSSQNRLIDFNYFFKMEEFRLSITGYYSHGDLDTKSLENFEYTKSKYLQDRKLWGAYLNNPTLAGTPSSPQNNRSLSISLFYEDMELGYSNRVDDDCYGINYPFDKMQISPKWIEPESELYFKNSVQLSEQVKASTLLRFRECDVSNESTSIEASGEYGKPQKIGFGYWQSLNRGYSAFQDFDLDALDYLSIKTGIRYEIKELQRAYDLPYGKWLIGDEIIDLTQDSLFPEPPANTFKNEKHDTWTEEGAYFQTKLSLSQLFDFSSNHFINMGIRYDNSSYYGENVTFRAGYVGQFDNYYFKYLYGQGYKEPAARQLYGGWTALGNNPNLKPEESMTHELILGYSDNKLNFSLNPFYNSMTNMIMDIAKVPMNHGQMYSYGIDVIGKASIKIDRLKQFKIWASYSYTHTNENKYDENTGVLTGEGYIGDIADHKLHYGLDAVYKDISLNLRGRTIGIRKTVDSNPIDQVPAYTTLDLNLNFAKLFSESLTFSLKITNLFDAKVFHAGIRKANSGDTPGQWIGDDWYGSKGFYNSLLPQPGRMIYACIKIEY